MFMLIAADSSLALFTCFLMTMAIVSTWDPKTILKTIGRCSKHLALFVMVT